MVNPILPSGSPEQPIHSTKDHRMIAHCVELDEMILTLKQIRQTAQSVSGPQQTAKKGRSHSNSADPAVSDYCQYTKQLIKYLQSHGVPSAAIDYLNQQLSEIDPSTPNAYKLLNVLMHQICMIGNQVDPHFAAAVTHAFAPGDPIADQSLKNIQQQLANLESAMGPEAKYFEDILKVQGFISNLPASCSSMAELSDFFNSLKDLATGAQDPSWGSAIRGTFSALASMPQLSDALGTMIFLQIFSSSCNGSPFSATQSSLQAALSKQIQSLDLGGLPFLTAIASKLNWWSNNYQTKGEPYLTYGKSSAPWPAGESEASLAGSWTNQLISAVDATPASAISQALSSLQSAMGQIPNWPEISPIIDSLNQLTAVDAVFKNVANGDLAAAFPFGPSIAGSAQNAVLNATLSACIQALIEVILQDHNSMLTPQLLNLLENDAGPPFGPNIIKDIQLNASEIQALVPFTKQQQNGIFKPLMQQLQNEINALNSQKSAASAAEARNKSEAAAVQSALANIASMLTGDPSKWTWNDWQKMAGYFYTLINAVANLPQNDPVYLQVASFLGNIQSTWFPDDDWFGGAIYYYMQGKGMSDDKIIAWFHQVAGSPDSSPIWNNFGETFNGVSEAASHSSGWTPQGLTSWMQSLNKTWAQNMDQVRSVFQTASLALNTALFQQYEDQIAQLSNQIGSLTTLQSELQKIF